MTNVEVILSIVLVFDTLCLLFMYIKLSEVSWSMDILDDRSRSNKDKLNAIDARMEDIRKIGHEKRVKEKMAEALRKGDFGKAVSIEDITNQLYEMAHEEDKND